MPAGGTRLLAREGAKTAAWRGATTARVTFALGVHVCGLFVEGWRSRRVHLNRCPAGLDVRLDSVCRA